MTKSPTPDDLESLLEQNRAELAATIDELTHRLNPRVQLGDCVARAKKLFHDAGMDPATTTQDRNRARKVLGTAAAAITVVTAAVVAHRR